MKPGVIRKDFEPFEEIAEHTGTPQRLVSSHEKKTRYYKYILEIWNIIKILYFDIQQSF